MKHFAILAGLLLAFGTTMGAQTTEKTTIKGGKGNLAAVIQKPKMKEGEKVRVAIICHGFTGYKEETLLCHIADSLQQAGIASIRFDFNGHGASEGTLQEMTVQNELEDARRVVAYALEQPWVTDVSLVGHSQGGVVSSMLAGQLGHGIRAVALCAPAAVLREDALRGELMGTTYDPQNIPEYVEIFGGKRVGRAYFEEAQTLPIYETAARYDGPVIILHGTADRIVPYTFGERYRREYKNGELVLMPGVDHMFGGEQNNCRVAAIITRFMLAH